MKNKSYIIISFAILISGIIFVPMIVKRCESGTVVKGDRLDNVSASGQTEESLRRLRGPIGIFIGSKTPWEIAVSVMAEIVAVKNLVKLPREAAVDVAKG